MSYPPSQFHFTQGVVVDVEDPPVRTVTVNVGLREPMSTVMTNYLQIYTIHVKFWCILSMLPFVSVILLIISLQTDGGSDMHTAKIGLRTCSGLHDC